MNGRPKETERQKCRYCQHWATVRAPISPNTYASLCDECEAKLDEYLRTGINPDEVRHE